MTRRPPSVPWLLTFVLVSGCGGVVSLGDPGSGKDGLGGSGDDATTDTGTATGATDAATGSDAASGSDTPSSFPGMGTAQDGSVAAGDGEFTEFIWQRWWDCGSLEGGPICKQEFWMNAECKAFYNDRDLFVRSYALSASRCKEFTEAIVSSHLAAALQDPTPCVEGPNGGKIYHLHLGGHLGPKYEKRVDGCSGGTPAGDMDKLVLGATRDIPDLDIYNNIPHIDMK